MGQIFAGATATGKWQMAKRGNTGQRGKGSKGNREKRREVKGDEKREQRSGSREEEAEKKRQQFKKGATKTSSGLFAQSLWIAN